MKTGEYEIFEFDLGSTSRPDATDLQLTQFAQPESQCALTAQ